MTSIAFDPLIAEAKERSRRRRLLVLVAAGILLACAAGLEFSVSGTGGGTSGTIPWLATKPNVGQANPPLAPPCTASQLQATMFAQSAAGSLAGGIDLVNRSSSACSLVGRPVVALGGRPAQFSGSTVPGIGETYDPLVPPMGSLRALEPGRYARVGLTWTGICDGPRGSKLPHTLAITAPGGGTVPLTAAPNLPSCTPFPGSAPVASRYAPVIPQGPPSSALPLRVSIVPDGGSTLVAHSGSWLSFTAVLTNKSSTVFRFGRACPAYTEGVGATENQAYVLNCHGVGPIAPHRSVRFAMRVFVPKNVEASGGLALAWTLAPHSWSAPSAPATPITLR